MSEPQALIPQFFRYPVVATALLLSMLASAQQVPRKSGTAAPDTGSPVQPPRLEHVATVAPDILAIEIQVGRILPMRQIPYQKDPGDRVERSFFSKFGEPRAVRVTRNGFPLGLLAGPERNILSLYERLVGEPLDVEAADKPASYVVTSPDDPNYRKGVAPSAVWRKSKPTNWTENGPPGEQPAAIRHYVYLKFPQALRAGKQYTVRFRGLNLDRAAINYLHDPDMVRSEAVHTSHIGFRPDDPTKSAFLSIWLGTGGGHSYPPGLRFSLIREATGERVYRGQTTLAWSAKEPEEIGSRANHNKTDLYRMEFGGFRSPGHYRVCVEGVGCGYPFEIGTGVWTKGFRVSMKGFYHQRLGIPLLPPFTDFIRPRGFHPLDGLKIYQSTCSLLYSGNGLNALGTEKNNFDCLVAQKTNEVVAPVWGGYADAADWDRRIQHLFATRQHLELAELFPEFFSTLSLNIPESDNQFPDVLDEALFDLDFYRRLQMPDGGVRGGLESSEHPNLGETSWQDSLTLMAYAPDCWSSYIYAGVAARAALLLRGLESGLASTYEASAIRAFQWAEVEYERWKQGSDYAKVTERAKSQIPPERSLAAVELYRLTRDQRWHAVFLETSGLRQPEADRTATLNPNAAFVYARLDASQVEADARRRAVEAIVRRADELVRLSKGNAFGLTTAEANRPIGIGDYSQPAAQELVQAHVLTGEPIYLETMLRSALYSAGANPMNSTMTTGVGHVWPLNPRHHDSRRTGQVMPVGITVFGPLEITDKFMSGFRRPPAALVTQCTPALVEWPAAETYFDLYRYAAMSEFVPYKPMGLTSYVWGYLAARR